MRAALFDVDGVILDSIGFHRNVWQRYCDGRGLDFAAVWPAVMRGRWPDILTEHVPHLDQETELAALWKLCADFREMRACDGVADLLNSLNADEWAIVTSGQRTALNDIFPTLGLPLPRVLIDGTTVTAGKPDPEGYLLAADKLGAQPGECLVIEDTPTGIEAGRAAGMRVVGVTGTHEAAELKMAHTVVTSMNQVSCVVRAWLGR